MTVTRSSRPPPSYSQSLVNNQNAPARPSVITCAPPASTSWGDQSSDVKSTNRDESGRQGHRRELLSGEFVLYCVLETDMRRHDVMHKNCLSVFGVFCVQNCELNFKNVLVCFILVCCLKLKHLKNLKIMQRRIIFLCVIYYSIPHVEFVLKQTTKSMYSP